MDAVSPVLLYEVIPAPTVAISAYVPPEPVFLSILNPVSSEELSVQERSIWLLDAAVADKPLGAAGGRGTSLSTVTPVIDVLS